MMQGQYPGGAPERKPYEDDMITGLLANSKYLEAIAKIDLESYAILTAIKERLKAERKHLYLTLPDGGGLQGIQAGATEINFYTGEIMHPDGTVTTMRSSLKTQELEFMRSFVLVTQGSIDFSIDGGGFYTLGAGERFSLADYDFRSLYISATTAGYFKLLASSTPEMTSFYDRYFSQDLETSLGPMVEELYDALENVQQRVTLDTGASMYRVNLEAYGTASTATDWTLEASNDNVHWFDIDSEEAQATYHFGGHNATQYIRLTSAAGGGAGDKVSLVLTSTR